MAKQHVGRATRKWQEWVFKDTGLTPEQAPELLETGKETPTRHELSKIAKDLIAQSGYEDNPEAIDVAVGKLMDVLSRPAA